MNQVNTQAAALVLYKGRPARVLKVAEKIEIELKDGNHARVRAKDVTLLHPGPIEGLDEFVVRQDDSKKSDEEVELAWQIMLESGGGGLDLEEFAELIYSQYTPASAWEAWKWLDDGLYFRGSPDAIVPKTPDEVQRLRSTRHEREVQAQAWNDFLDRARRNSIDISADKHYLRDVEDFALGRREESQVLRDLGSSKRPESAHALLLACGYWDHTVLPYAARFGLPGVSPQMELPTLAEEERLDLTHLTAYAIDDRDNRDPDDAISLDRLDIDQDGRLLGGRIWVHIADASALVAPDSPIDLEARSRAATLYRPEGAVSMLPLEAIEMLGLGLQDQSPAFSFGLEMNAAGELTDISIHPSWVRVQRLSYKDADRRLNEEPLNELLNLTNLFEARRHGNGAMIIDLPEVIVRVVEGVVSIRPVERLRSRILVREAMLMVGEAAARYAHQHDIPFPYAIQESADPKFFPRDGLADPRIHDAPEADLPLEVSYAIRRSLKRSHVSLHPAPHAGVGLPLYSRATSPLRRYLDLVAHQQLRTYLRGEPILNEDEVLERVGASGAVTANVNLAESLSRRHWTLVYLMQHPAWEGEGVLVEKHDLRGRVIIPELALEVPLHLRHEMPLGSRIGLKFTGCNLPDLDVYFNQI